MGSNSPVGGSASDRLRTSFSAWPASQPSISRAPTSKRRRVTLVPYPSYRSLLVIDIEKSGSRTDRAKPTMRAALYEVLATAFRDAGIEWERCEHEDRGDGAIVLIPAAVEKVLIVDHLIGRLQTALWQHNSTAAESARLRVRVALHAGEVTRDGKGWSGRDLDHVFRLNNTPVLRRVLSRCTNSALALIASQAIHDAVLRHGHGPPDLAYIHQVEVDALPAWIWVPGYRNPLGLEDPPADSAPPDSSADRTDSSASAQGSDGAQSTEPDDDRPRDTGVSSKNQSGGTTAGRISVGGSYISGDQINGATRWAPT